MNSQVFIGMCVMLGGLGAWNTWTLHQLNERIDRIEVTQGPSTTPVAASSQYESTSSSYASSVPSKKESVVRKKAIRNPKITYSDDSQKNPPIDLSDPDVREAIAKIAQDNAQQKETQRRQSKMEAYKNSVQHELEKFSNEKDYDTETTQKIEAILDESTSEWTAVREQVREGEIPWMDARTEFKAIGDETEAKVTEFISEEDYKELRSRLW